MVAAVDWTNKLFWASRNLDAQVLGLDARSGHPNFHGCPTINFGCPSSGIQKIWMPSSSAAATHFFYLFYIVFSVHCILKICNSILGCLGAQRVGFVEPVSK